MNSFCSLDEQFANALNEIKQYKFTNDYEKMLGAIKKAMGICQRIYEESSDREKKNLMTQNAINLKSLYQQCQDRLGNVKEQVLETNPTKTTKKTEPQKAGSPENINYEINGVDVKQFLIDESNDKVMFDDVIGMESEKKLIKREFFLSDKQREFKRRKGMVPKNFVLLYGVPGTGKTFFAKAISCELKEANLDNTEIPFFSVVGTQLKDCKVGATEKNIQALFEFCKQFEHCVLFIDEFDSLVPDRAKNTGDPTAQSTVTTFLQMMDGFSSGNGTLLISATNCPYNLDGGVLSRADAEIEIPLPSKEVIYKTLVRKVGDDVASDADLDAIANHLVGYSNRDVKKYIANLNDQLFDAFSNDEQKGINKDMEEYKITNEMFNRAYVNIPSSVKQSDLDNIKAYKEKREEGAQ